VSLVSALLAYAFGSVPFALLVARSFGTRDLRVAGSGNLGATNVARTSGLTAGALVAVLDIAKGACGVLTAGLLTRWDPPSTATAAVSVVIGHVYPVWNRFQGGKGVAAGFGAFVVLEPRAAFLALGAFLLGATLTRFVSVGSVLAAVTLPIAVYVAGSRTPTLVAALVTAGLVIFRHRSNVARLLAGTERRLGARA
jgi:glycerol-3-phosphate acyltransferase PlsY